MVSQWHICGQESELTGDESGMDELVGGGDSEADSHVHQQTKH